VPINVFDPVTEPMTLEEIARVRRLCEEDARLDAADALDDTSKGREE